MHFSYFMMCKLESGLCFKNMTEQLWFRLKKIARQERDDLTLSEKFEDQ